MKNIISLKGEIFGRLLVVEDAGVVKGNSLWRCVCSCGSEKDVVVRAYSLKNGSTKSCGCLHKEKVTLLQTKHGLSKHPIYMVWIGMKDRCYNTKHTYYDLYGGKGVVVCARWLESVGNFIEDVYNGYQKGLQLDRIDNSGNYRADNVRWVTPSQNQMNKDSNRNSSSKYKGVCLSQSKWLVNICKDGENTYLGSFTCEKEAAMTYNKAAKELFGEYANLNIIEEN